MKKLLLVATIGVAGLMNANNVEHNDKKKEDEITKAESKAEKESVKQTHCSPVTYDGPCTGRSFPDTICWEVGNWNSLVSAINCFADTYEQILEDDCDGGI